jgi:hypothetical protein
VCCAAHAAGAVAAGVAGLIAGGGEMGFTPGASENRGGTASQEGPPPVGRASSGAAVTRVRWCGGCAVCEQLLVGKRREPPFAPRPTSAEPSSHRLVTAAKRRNARVLHSLAGALLPSLPLP